MAKIAKLTELLVDRCRRRYKRGDKAALLEAVYFCAQAGLVMPEWLTKAYGSAYTKWSTYQVRSLDEAFGVAQDRKGRKLRALQNRESLKAKVAAEVNRLRKIMATDEHLFEEAGVNLNMPMGQVRAINYDKTNHWPRFDEGIRKMTVPEWLKTMVLFEVDDLCKGKTPTEKQLTKVGARVNLSAEQVRTIYIGKGRPAGRAVKTSE